MVLLFSLWSQRYPGRKLFSIDSTFEHMLQLYTSKTVFYVEFPALFCAGEVWDGSLGRNVVCGGWEHPSELWSVQLERPGLLCGACDNGGQSEISLQGLKEEKLSVFILHSVCTRKIEPFVM